MTRWSEYAHWLEQSHLDIPELDSPGRRDRYDMTAARKARDEAVAFLEELKAGYDPDDLRGEIELAFARQEFDALVSAIHRAIEEAYSNMPMDGSYRNLRTDDGRLIAAWERAVELSDEHNLWPNSYAPWRERINKLDPSLRAATLSRSEYYNKRKKRLPHTL